MPIKKPGRASGLLTVMTRLLIELLKFSEDVEKNRASKLLQHLF